MKKSEVRQEIFRKRREISDEETVRLSSEVFGLVEKYIFGLERQGTPVTEVFAYASYSHETDTWAFLQECLDKGMRVALPRVCSDGSSMEFYYIAAPKDVEKGYKGIPEPSENCERADCLNGSENRIILVPGVGFDRKRNRVGYGKGFYDRYLAAHTFRKKIAVAFEFQIFDEIECEDNDIKPDVVITEKEIYGER